jgi:hypothetical protein
MEQHYLSKAKDYLIDCGFINNDNKGNKQWVKDKQKRLMNLQTISP